MPLQKKSRPRFYTFFLKFFWLENASNNSNNVIFSEMQSSNRPSSMVIGLSYIDNVQVALHYVNLMAYEARQDTIQ